MSDDALDGLDRAAFGLHRENETAAHDVAVEPDRAGAAHAVLAADMGAGQTELVADEVGEMRARRHARRDRLAVDREGYPDLGVTRASFPT